MRVEEWLFLERTHPVYERPPEAERWPVPLPGLEAAEYREEAVAGEEQPVVVEPLRMEMVGYRSVTIYRTPGGQTIQKVVLRSRYARFMDLSEIERIAREWFARLMQMSLGPYTLKELRRMGHPYGYGPRGSRPSWHRLLQPRCIPRMGRAAYIAGWRGRVPDRSIINIQTGNLFRSWYYRILPWHGGVTIIWGNRAEYAWYLVHGTAKMQAHGPWETVARRLLPRLHAAWRRAAQAAWRRLRAQEAQFSADAVAAQRLHAEAGGFE